MPAAPAPKDRHHIKRYSLARLYDTTALAYVDLARLRAMAHAGTPVIVTDARTGEDITATLLRPRR